jgi:cyclic beta-1,2-glucan synthetase
MEAVRRHLVATGDRTIRLLTPPFDITPDDPGYIKGYAPGIRENGGQYTHASLWVVRAAAELGRNDWAAPWLGLLNPIRHARTPEQVSVYQVEPYVIAADVYGRDPHCGRGGWTWYTGSAAWMYRVALESVLGFRIVDGAEIRLKPCVPDGWPGFRIACGIPGRDTRYEIEVSNPGRKARSVVAATVDGRPVGVEDGEARIPLAGDGRVHRVAVVLGDREP